ncbi:hypothetical protein PSAC2689_10133 [Paraburkholderia sacchari]|uniref:LysR family transcriptional regulator n=1 Tax=Paraburkholderia sacchari TaxID=159450 RepID=UPI0039A56448
MPYVLDDVLIPAIPVRMRFFGNCEQAMLDRLTSISVFTNAAATGSLAVAAGKLGKSSQMVAKHVGTLERQLGMRLLNRTTRKQSMTEFGRLYLERCQAILAEVPAADALAQTINDDASWEAARQRTRHVRPLAPYRLIT